LSGEAVVDEPCPDRELIGEKKREGKERLPYYLRRGENSCNEERCDEEIFPKL
jgi:hypothetical protein